MLKRGNVPLKLSSTCNHLDNYKSHHIFALKKLSPKQCNRAQCNTFLFLFILITTRQQKGLHKDIRDIDIRKTIIRLPR